MIDSLYSTNNGKFLRDFKRIVKPTDNCLLYVAKNGDQSYVITYKNFKKNFYDRFFYDLSVGSMVYKRSFQYSLSGHNHDGIYNKVTYESLYKEDGESVYDELATLVNKDGEETTIISPYITTKLDNEITIGTVKFIYNKKNHFCGLSGINDENFNGWIIPNGEHINVNLIKSSGYDWNTNPYYNNDTNEIDIPLLSSFIKLNPSPSAYINQIQDYKNSIKQHNHRIIDLSGSVHCSANSENNDFGINFSGNETDIKDAIFTGGQYSSINEENISGNITISGTKIAFTLSSNYQEQEIYPTYDYIPILLYIGGSRI